MSLCILFLLSPDVTGAASCHPTLKEADAGGFSEGFRLCDVLPVFGVASSL